VVDLPLPVLDVIARVDRRDGEAPAYRYRTPCCAAVDEISAWVVTTAWLYGSGRMLVNCRDCHRWQPVRAPVSDLDAPTVRVP
jgi:hypothetical protein